MRFSFVLLIVISLILLVPPQDILAEVGNFNASADAYLQSGSPNANNGTNVVMDLNNTRDGVVRFDISSIPAGSTVIAATLTLVATGVGSASAVKNYSSHRILVDWTEGAVTWNTPGSTADLHFTSSITDTVAVSTTGSYNWDVLSDVSNFVSGTTVNYGWRIIWSSNTSGTSKQVDFGTKENITASNRPVLSVTYTPPDTTAPTDISDLAISNTGQTTASLTWTAPGDDGNSGTASSYDLRYSTAAINSGNFSSATQVSGEPTPSAAGANESITISGLSATTLYYFAIKTSDEVPNTSAISNVVNTTTTAFPDTTAPGAVNDLAIFNPSSSSLLVSWTAPGDDGDSGTASSYDLRYSTSAINSGNFSSATQASGEPTPSAAGASESMTVSGLTSNTTYYFALKTSDEESNQSDISNIPSLGTSAVSVTPSTSTSSGNDGGGGNPRAVIFSGQAYPGSEVELLWKTVQDGSYVQVPLKDKEISANGSFVISYTAILGGDYLFALQVKDKDGRSTGVLAYNVSLKEDLFEVKDILVQPTIGFEKSSVSKDQILKVMGYAAPNNTVELEVDGLKYKEIKADQSGFWSLDIDAIYLAYGEHRARVRQIDSSGKMSIFSPMRIFRISKLPFTKADLDGNGVINISDWSIFLFHWGSDDESVRKQNDLNGDGQVNIFDFSIFLQAIKI